MEHPQKAEQLISIRYAGIFQTVKTFRMKILGLAGEGIYYGEGFIDRMHNTHANYEII